MGNELVSQILSEVTIPENEDFYDALIDECKDIITETIFISRFTLVEGYHSLGKRIVDDEYYRKYKPQIQIKQIAKDIGISERTLYYAIQFYETYPDLDKVPEGKNITWNRIITQYLPRKDKVKKECQHEELITICKHCKKAIKNDM